MDDGNSRSPDKGRWRREALRTAAQSALADDALPQRLRAVLLDLLQANDRLAAELADARNRAELLEKLAAEDPLVPVLNRRGFIRELERAISYVARHGTPAALIFIDLDSFKTVNDRFGHPVGDAALRHFGSILSESIRTSDSIGRLGGDEFGILLWNASRADAVAKAGDLKSLIARSPFECEGRLIAIGASAGATAIHGRDSPDAALGRADKAMYADKSSGARRA